MTSQIKIHLEVELTSQMEGELEPEEEWPEEIRDLFEGWDVKIIKLEVENEN